MSRFGLGFVSGGGTPGNDAFTKILLHFDGANGSTTFTDSNAGGAAKTWTASVGSQISTAIAPKFGTACLYGNNSQISTPDSGEFTLGTSDWTVDFWLNPNGSSGGGFQGLFGQQGAGSFPADYGISAYRDNTNKIIFIAGIGATAPSMASTSTFAGTSWVHIAIVRNGSTFTLYVNGVSEASFSNAGSINNSTSKFGVSGGGSVVPDLSVLFFDEFRLSVGIARWTANFTPPVSAYT